MMGRIEPEIKMFQMLRILAHLKHCEHDPEKPFTRYYRDSHTFNKSSFKRLIDRGWVEFVGKPYDCYAKHIYQLTEEGKSIYKKIRPVHYYMTSYTKMTEDLINKGEG